MVPITLNSNLSYESIQLIPVSMGDCNGEFELRINGQHWDGDHEHAVRLTSESILLSCGRLRLLVDNIHIWLELDSSLAFAGEYPLAVDTANAELTLIFADRSDTISSDDKPVVTATYRIGRLVGEFSFVTDQSCLKLFADETKRLISTVAG